MTAPEPLTPQQFAEMLKGFSDKALMSAYRALLIDDSNTAGPWVKLAVCNEVGDRFCKALGV